MAPPRTSSSLPSEAASLSDEAFAQRLHQHYVEIGRRGGIAARDRGSLARNIRKAQQAWSEQAAARRAAQPASDRGD